MGAAQQLALRILKAQCQAVEERYPGYRVDMVRRLAAILQLERQGAGAATKEKVASELQDFGDTLGRKTGTEEA
jgi:hypothetical protein